MPAAVTFTVYEKPAADGPLSKTITLGPEGRPVSDGSSCVMMRGCAKTITLPGLVEFAAFLSTLTPQMAIGLGVIDEAHRLKQKDGSPGPTEVVRDRDLNAAPPGAISRTQRFITFTPGQPALMLIDHDQKGMPAAVREFIAALGEDGREGTFLDALFAAVPGLAQAGFGPARIDVCGHSEQGDRRELSRLRRSHLLPGARRLGRPSRSRNPSSDVLARRVRLACCVVLRRFA